MQPVYFAYMGPITIAKPEVIYGRGSRARLTLKGPGFFVYLKAGGRGGGAGFRPPPSDLGRGATKNSEIWHARRVSQYERADKISILKIKPFFNYANLC